MVEAYHFWSRDEFDTRIRASEAVRYMGLKNLKQIAEAIDECDVGIISNRRSIFSELNTPMRIFEFMCQSRPVIAPCTPGILDYFGLRSWCFLNWATPMILRKRLML
jgi:hypothetical protein